MKFVFKFTAAIIVLVLLVQFAAAEDWTMFRHDLEHSGETTDVIQNPENLELIWKFKTGDSVRSSPAISGDTAFIGSEDNHIYCLNKNTGELIWKFKTGNYVTSSPAISGNYAFVGSYDNYIYCLNKNTGELKWKFKTGGWVRSSPAVSGDYAFVGSYDNYIYCLNKNTGELKWKFKTGNNVWSSPAISGDNAFVGSFDNYIYCLNKNTGELIWKFKTGGGVDSSPAISGDNAFVGSFDNYIYCLNKNTGELIWKFKTGGGVDSSPAISGNYAFVGSKDNYVYCLNKNTGELIWKFKTGIDVLSSPAISGDNAFVGSFDRYIYCLNKNTGELTWKFKTGSLVYSSPAISGDNAFVGSFDSYVYAFGEKENCPHECCVNLEGYKNKECLSDDFSCVNNKCVKIKNKENDEICSANSECKTGNCFKGVCKEQGYTETPEKQVEKPSEPEEKESKNKPLGASCSANSECQSNNCLEGFCVLEGICKSDSDCPSGEYCSNNKCGIKKGNDNDISQFLILGAIILIIIILIYFSTSKKKGGAREETTITPTNTPEPTPEFNSNHEQPKPKPTPTTTSPKITLSNIKKSYQSTEILKSISLEFEDGKIYAIVGPSGCGKSRLIESIIGRVTPDSGTISVFGVDSEDKRRVNEIVGFVPQHPELYTEQTVMQNMQNSAIKWGIGVREFEGAEKILKEVDLIERKDVSAKSLSGGQVKRLSLAMELLRNPQVLLLDEPTTGLDPTMRMKIMGIFEKLNRTEGKLIIFTTHYMDEIDICDEVVIMKAGEVLVKAGLDELRRRTPGRGKVVEVTLYTPLAGIAGKLEADGKIEKVIDSGRNLHIFTHEPNVADITNKVTSLGGVVEGSRVTTADMRDLFIYYTDELPEGE